MKNLLNFFKSIFGRTGDLGKWLASEVAFEAGIKPAAKALFGGVKTAAEWGMAHPEEVKGMISYWQMVQKGHIRPIIFDVFWDALREAGRRDPNRIGRIFKPRFNAIGTGLPPKEAEKKRNQFIAGIVPSNLVSLESPSKDDIAEAVRLTRDYILELAAESAAEWQEDVNIIDTYVSDENILQNILKTAGNWTSDAWNWATNAAASVYATAADAAHDADQWAEDRAVELEDHNNNPGWFSRLANRLIR